jgi:hypothetical protein
MIDLLLDYMNTTVEALEKAKKKNVDCELSEYREGLESQSEVSNVQPPNYENEI